jgi:hypothetical protein
MKFVIRSFAIILFLCISAIAIEAQQKNPAPETKQDMGWQQLGKGLELGTFLAPQPAVVGDSLVRVLRIDPKYYRFRLLNASAIENGAPLTPKQWCRQNGLIAAINPSMFQTDYKTSVSLMRTRTHTNNPRLSKDMTILASDSGSKSTGPWSRASACYHAQEKMSGSSSSEDGVRRQSASMPGTIFYSFTCDPGTVRMI